MASPPPVVDTSPNGSSLGNMSGLRRAIHLSSPIDGSIRISEGYTHEWPARFTFCDISCHMDNGISIVDHEILCQCVRLARYLDIVTCIIALINNPTTQLVMW